MKTEIQIPIGDIRLAGALAIPESAFGLVIFAHGSGSSRHSPRNRHVARFLNERGLATLLFDLTTPDEERIDALDTTLRFDVDMLAERLTGATDSIAAVDRTTLHAMPIGYFGSSTGAAAAVIAAARRSTRISAVVSRGGRLDLATSSLPEVRAPTLLIVGGADKAILQINRDAAKRLTAPHQLVIVPNATHLFEEPGALDEVARLAASWFFDHFVAKQIREAS